MVYKSFFYQPLLLKKVKKKCNFIEKKSSKIDNFEGSQWIYFTKLSEFFVNIQFWKNWLFCVRKIKTLIFESKKTFKK